MDTFIETVPVVISAMKKYKAQQRIRAASSCKNASLYCGSMTEALQKHSKSSLSTCLSWVFQFQINALPQSQPCTYWLLIKPFGTNWLLRGGNKTSWFWNIWLHVCLYYLRSAEIVHSSSNLVILLLKERVIDKWAHPDIYNKSIKSIITNIKHLLWTMHVLRTLTH